MPKPITAEALIELACIEVRCAATVERGKQKQETLGALLDALQTCGHITEATQERAKLQLAEAYLSCVARNQELDRLRAQEAGLNTTPLPGVPF